jgi:hypothetical protein
MGLLSALGRRGMRSLESGQMFGRRPISHAAEIAENEANRYMAGQIQPRFIPQLKAKLMSGGELTESEAAAAQHLQAYLSPEERVALEVALDRMHAGGGQALPVQSGFIPVPGGGRGSY